MRVLWTETAIAQLRSIHRYIAQSSPEYARQTVDRLTRRARQISEFPQSGRTVPEFEMPEIREIVEGNYRLIYLIKPDAIEILALIHGAQKLE